MNPSPISPDPLWGLLLAGFEQTLAARGRSPRTRKIYTDAASGLVAWLTGGQDPPAGPADPPAGPDEITKDHVERFLIHFGTVPTERRPAGRGTAYVNQTFRALQQWFRWLVDEDEAEVSPMARMTPPRISARPVPILELEALRALVAACAGRDLEARRDTAIIRMLADTGCRRTEIARLRVGDVDLARRRVTVTGKGNRTRTVAVGNATATAVSRYLRARARDAHAARPQLWLATRGRGPLTGDGIRQMLERRAEQAGIGHVHPHMFRHTLSHDWLQAGGGEQALADHMGWSTTQMAARYGAIGRERRAQGEHERLGLGDRF